jgi:hypothetical protein
MGEDGEGEANRLLDEITAIQKTKIQPAPEV